MNKPLCELTHIEALARIEELEAEATENFDLLGRLSDLLRGVANALNGPPGELFSHSWHNLPELARAACGDTETIRARATPLAVWWTMLCAEHETSGAPPMGDADVILTWPTGGALATVTGAQLRALFAAIYPEKTQ